MARAIDPHFDGSERLFRSVSADHVVEGQILPSAVEMPQCSFNRQKYAAEPTSVFVASRPRDNGVVALAAGNLPDPVPRQPKPPETTLVPLEFYVIDQPEETNDAHAEVRVRPVGSAGSANYKIKDKALKLKAQEALARKLTLLIPPT